MLSVLKRNVAFSFRSYEQHSDKKVPHCGKTEIASNEDGDRWRRQPRMLTSCSLILSTAQSKTWAILTTPYSRLCRHRAIETMVAECATETAAHTRRAWKRENIRARKIQREVLRCAHEIYKLIRARAHAYIKAILSVLPIRPVVQILCRKMTSEREQKQGEEGSQPSIESSNCFARW